MAESKLSKAFNSILNRIKGKRSISLKNADLIFSKADQPIAKVAEAESPFESEKFIVKN